MNPVYPSGKAEWTTPGRPEVEFVLDPGFSDTGWLRFGGDWNLGGGEVSVEMLRLALESQPSVRKVRFDLAGLPGWGTGLVAFLLECRRVCREVGREFDDGDLPEGLARMLDLALPPGDGFQEAGVRVGLNPVELVGATALAFRREIRDAVAFLGECTLALVRGVRGRAYFRRSDFLVLLQQCGAEALPIVSLIAFLVGLILAFVGAVQLERFGASIYVADLVAIAMTREMGCVMVAIVLCGRTGASFAAYLGTMKVNQELDAFRVFGISSVDFLVMPRILALVLMIPLLTLYADLVGILGGFFVARLMLGLSVVEYWDATMNALTFAHLGAGLVKSVVFGCIIAFTGCFRGLGCGSNAAAVGAATTSAVVVAITGVVAADAVFALLFNILGI